MRQGQKVWLTKYAMRQGILVAKVRGYCGIFDKHVDVEVPKKYLVPFCRIGVEVHTTERAALKRAIEMCAAKALSLEKTKTRLLARADSWRKQLERMDG